MRLLFVCTGNICRSPIAERLAAAYAMRNEISELAVASAGTRAVVAHSVHPEAARVLEALGGDPSNFAARRLTAKIASAADLVVTMTRAHRDSVLELAPHMLRTTYTLTEVQRLATAHGAHDIDALANLRRHLASSDLPDIPDPIGQTTAVFNAVGAQIAELLPPVLELCRPR